MRNCPAPCSPCCAPIASGCTPCPRVTPATTAIGSRDPKVDATVLAAPPHEFPRLRISCSARLSPFATALSISSCCRFWISAVAGDMSASISGTELTRSRSVSLRENPIPRAVTIPAIASRVAVSTLLSMSRANPATEPNFRLSPPLPRSPAYVGAVGCALPNSVVRIASSAARCFGSIPAAFHASRSACWFAASISRLPSYEDFRNAGFSHKDAGPRSGLPPASVVRNLVSVAGS